MKIRFRLFAGICALLVGGGIVVVAQANPEPPMKTTVCELLKHPDSATPFNWPVLMRPLLAGLQVSPEAADDLLLPNK